MPLSAPFPLMSFRVSVINGFGAKPERQLRDHSMRPVHLDHNSGKISEWG